MHWMRVVERIMSDDEFVIATNAIDATAGTMIEKATRFVESNGFNRTDANGVMAAALASEIPIKTILDVIRA